MSVSNGRKFGVRLLGFGVSMAAFTTGTVYAQCANSTANPLTNVQSGDTVTCAGTTTGATVAAPSPGGAVIVNISGSIANSSINIGSSGNLALAAGSTVNFGVTGTPAVSTAGGVNLQVYGNSAVVNIGPTSGNGWQQSTSDRLVVGGDGASLAFRGGALQRMSGTGPMVEFDGTTFTMTGGLVRDFTTAGLANMIVGSNRAQGFNISGNIFANAGREFTTVALDAGGGNDIINLVNGGIVGRLDGGAGNDTLNVAGSLSVPLYDITNVEQVNISLSSVVGIRGGLLTSTAVTLGNGSELAMYKSEAIAAGSTFALGNGSRLYLSTEQAGFVTGSGLISGGGNVDIGGLVGAGIQKTFIFNNANTYTGGTRIFDRTTVILNNGAGLGAGQIELAQPDVLLRLGGVAVTNNIIGAGRLSKTANNTAIISGNSTYSGGTSVLEGILQANGAQALGTGSIDIAANAQLNVNAVTDGVLNQDITGDGQVQKFGAGRLTLGGTNTFANGLYIAAGTVQANNGSALGSDLVAISAGATLDLSGAANYTTVNDISGDGRLVKSGTGTATLTGTNTYTGGTDIQLGALRVDDTSRLGTGGVTVQAGAALDLLIASASTFGQSISGAGLLRKSGAGDLTLTTNTLTGGLDITQGRVLVASTSAVGAGGATTAAGTSLVVSNSAQESFTTTLSGGGALVKDGNGDLVMQGPNDYSGGTLINAGRIILNNGAGLGTGAVVNNAALRLGTVTVTNNISGTGSVEKTSNGLGTLTGTNTHSGGTTVTAGTLQVNGAAALGTGTVTIATGATLNVNSTTAQQMANVMTGVGAFVKLGTGDLALNGSGLGRTGGTTISAGRLILNRGDALGAGAVVNNAALRIGDITLANSIGGTGSVQKTSTGVGVLSGANTYSGGTAVDAGTLRVLGLSAIGTGAVSVASGATLEFENATDVNFDLALSGGGAFRKLGAGRLTLSSPFSIGSLAVNAGRARINTAMTGSATVAAGASLDGTGTITGSLTNSGTLAPGNSIGTLGVGGNFTQTASGVLEIEFDTNGNRMDLLNVGGSATLGGTVRFISLDATEAFGGTFLNATGGVSGQFANVEMQGATLPVTILYNTSSGAVAPTVLTARPSTFNSQALAASDTSLAFLGGLAAQSPRLAMKGGWWLDAFGAGGKRDAQASTLAYEHDSSGTVMGFSAKTAAPGLVFGAAFGWSRSDIDLEQRAGGGSQDGMMGAGFLSWVNGVTTLTGGMFLGQMDQETVRNVSFNATTSTITGETSSDVLGAFASTEHLLGRYADWDFSGRAALHYVQQTQDAYTESGSSPLRLSVAERGYDTWRGEAVLQAEREFEIPGGRSWSMRAGVGVGHTDAAGNRAIPVRFAASGADVVLQGDERDITQGLVNADLEWRFAPNAALTLGYAGRFGDASSNSGHIGLGWKF